MGFVRKKHIINFLLLFFSLIVALLVCEIFLRILPIEINKQYFIPTSPLSCFQPDDHIPTSLLKNCKVIVESKAFTFKVTIDEKGFRKTENVKSDKVILILGDSFTFGEGVNDEETFAYLLEKRLGGTYDVINAGYAAGRSIDTYYVFLKKYLKTIKPSIVVVNFYNNDFKDVQAHTWHGRDENSMPEKITDEKRIMIKGGVLYTPRKINHYLPLKLMAKILGNSHLYAFFYERVRMRPEVRNFEDRKIYKLKYDYQDDKRWHTSIEAAIKLCMEHGVKLIFHQIPYKNQKELQSQNKIVSSLAKKYHVNEILNFSDESKSEYYLVDGHWNQLGHNLAAKLIYNEIVENYSAGLN